MRTSALFIACFGLVLPAMAAPQRWGNDRWGEQAAQPSEVLPAPVPAVVPAPAPAPTVVDPVPAPVVPEAVPVEQAQVQGGASYTGVETTYYNGGGTTACGDAFDASGPTVAMNVVDFAAKATCGRKVIVSNPRLRPGISPTAPGADSIKAGASFEATVTDLCPECAQGTLDLSEGLFTQLASQDLGRILVDWSWV